MSAACQLIPPIDAPAARRIASAGVSLIVLTVLAFLAQGPTVAEADDACDRFAAVSGSDTANGTFNRPFATPQRLVDSLSPGETGCMREGTYRGHAVFRTGGLADERKALQSFPGERAKIAGQVRVLESAAFVTIRTLDLDGSTAPRCGAATTCSVQASPWIQGDDTVVSDNDITNQNAGICVLVGTSGRSPAERTAFEYNRVHHCGRRPWGNLDHGFYLENATDTRIERNLIHDNVDRGVQLYPSSTGTVIRNNVLDGNGENVHFGGSSSDNRIEGNVITNARIRHNVESFASTDTRNTVRRNCVWGAPAPVLLPPRASSRLRSASRRTTTSSPIPGTWTARTGTSGSATKAPAERC